MTKSSSGPLFDVMSHDRHGDPVRCSYCAQDVERVVVMPLSSRPELDDRIAESDGEELWLGLCAKCIDGMRLALVIGARMEGAS